MFCATIPPKEEPKADEALWLWGRLKDFERGAKKVRDRTTKPVIYD
jgi:hypothetical protein